MQQTKRRSKKGVILLALALALLVVAIVPAAALAAPATITVNGVLSPNPVTVGSNLVNVTYHSDVATARFVSFEVSPVPIAWGVAFPSPRKAYVPLSTDTETVSLGTGLSNGDQFYVRVTFYDLASGGSVVDGPATSGLITYNTDKSYSYLDLGSYGADGAAVPGKPPTFPGPPWADYSTTWFGPHYDPAGGPPGVWIPFGGLAQGDFEVWGAPAHSVVYDVDGLYTADLELDGATPQTPLAPFNPIPFYDADGILTSSGNSWIDSPAVYDGFHWVHHHAVAMTGSGDALPESYTVFGWDSTDPFWTINGISKTKWYGNAPVAWDAIVSDNPGSGVTTATVTPDYENKSLVPGLPIGTKHLEWTWWQSQASGTLVPAVNTANPLSWANSWDSNNLGGPVYVDFWARDAVLNEVDDETHLHFDLIAPHTTHTSDPATATSFVWNPNWTNKNVTVTFKAMDPGAAENTPLGSGVAYTEYIIGSSTSTPPGQSTTGTQGSSVVIDKNAPTGPVYLWFRSVDKADPANKEVWQKIFVYIDKPTDGSAGGAATTGPKLTNDVPSWWITDYPDEKQGMTSAVVVPFLFDFQVEFNATDPNSGIGPDMIRWRVLNWRGNPDAWPAFSDWNQATAPIGYSQWFDVHANAADDGIYNLESKVSDRAGNETTATTPVKIDTRHPVTDGAAGWINGTVPYVLTASDQITGAGVAATIYRVDQSTPWLENVSNESTPTGGVAMLETEITLTGGQGALHTIDFGSVDAALPYDYDVKHHPYHDGSPSYTWGNLEGTSWIWGHFPDRSDWGVIGFTGYETRSVKLDVTAPVVTAMDPKNGNWQKGPGTVNFSGTDVGSGYAYTEWKTSGTDWTKGEVAQIGGDGEITVTYHGVDKVGIKSADQTIVVKVASTHPTVTGANASVKRGHKATFKFNVTSVTPTGQVSIQIRTKNGKTLSTHFYNGVPTGPGQKSFMIKLKKGKYNIRIGAVDLAGNVQTKRGTGTLTVK